MKDMDLEMQKLTMDDSNDYDEYEEEFIDRDEEYEVDDDDEEYDDEEYDEDYDDEEYDDEDYDDGYDDGYDDSYYDERLNKVLDELAELKRSMANPPAVQNQPSYTQPTIPYVFAGNIPNNQQSAQPYSGEVLMYNEISRLRDELNKTQNSQNLHVELNRLKDEMERDRKYNESQYLNEIKRLNEKVETLQKNSLGPQSEDSAYLLESHASEGAIDGSSFNKLIAINESMLQNARSNDTYVQNELNEIKKKLSALDSEEFGRAVSAVKRLNKGMSSEEMTSLTGEITALKNAFAGSGISVSDNSSSVSAELKELKEIAEDKTSDSIVLLKKLSELHRAIGYADEKEAQEKDAAISLMDDLLAVRSKAVGVSFADNLYALADLEKKVSALSTSDAVALASACDAFADDIMRQPLDKKSIDDLIRFADDTAVFSVNREKREALDKFATISQRLIKCESAEIDEILPQILEVKAKLQDGTKQAADVCIAKEIEKLLSDAQTNDSRIKECVAAVCKLRACDFLRFPRVTVEFSAKESSPIVTLIEKADNILALLGDGVGASVASEQVSDSSLDSVKEEIVNLCTSKQLDDAVAELKSQYIKIVNALAALPEGAVSAETASAVSAMAEEAQYNNNELSDQMYNIRDELNKAIHDENLLTQDTLELKLTDITEAQRKATEDLEFIKEKLGETREIIAGVRAVRERTETTETDEGEVIDNKLYDDLCVQFDKLYEDVSTLLTGTENNIVDRVSESVDKLNENVNSTMETVNDIIDSINANIDNINALVNGVNTSLEGVNNNFDITNGNINNINTTFGDSFAQVTLALDEIRENIANLTASDVSALFADSVTELKMAVDDFIAKAMAYDDAALNDRLKLLEDVAYIRSREEGGESDALLRLRDDVMRDLNVLTDTVSGLNIDEMRDNVATIKDTLDILAADTSVGLMGEDLAELKENHRVLAETINNNAASNEEFVASVREDLAYIRERVDGNLTTDENSITVNDVYDVLATVNEKLDSVGECEQQDAQTVLGVLEDIKEQLHLKGLEPSIEGVTDSEEEKQTLLNEIAEVRERLAGLEEVAQGQSDTVSARLADVNDELTLIKDSILGISTFDGIDAVLNDITTRLDVISQDSANMTQLSAIAEDIAEIRSALTADGTESHEGISDMMQTVNDMSDKVKDFAERMELAALEIDSIPLVLSELGEVKQSMEEIKEKLAAFDGASVAEESVTDSDAIARRLDILSDKTNEIIERSENGITSDESLREVSDGIAEIRDSLFADYEKIKDDITFIRNQIELNVEEADAEAQLDLGDGDLSSILEELAEIKEKLAATDEYDVMSEILSLREDMKSARLTDTDDVGELEKVKSDIVEHSDLLAEEIRNLRNDLSGILEGRTASGEPTGDELNMVLNEIVSLRDEIQSYKDELSVRSVSHEDVTAEGEEVELQESTGDDFGVILDELTDMRSELVGFKEESRELKTEEIEPLKNGIDELRESLDELKDIISRRTSISAEPSGGGEETVSVSGLDVVLNELINLKQEVEDVRNQVSEEIQAVREAISSEEGELGSDFAEEETDNKYEEILAAVESLKENRIAVESDEGALDVLSELLLLHSEINDIRHVLDDKDKTVPNNDEVESEYAADGAAADLKEELAAIRQLLTEQRENSHAAEIEMLRDEITGLRQELAGGEYVARVQDNVEVDSELGSLREEIISLKEQLAASHSEAEPDMSVMNEILSLREEISSLKEQMSTQQTTSSAEPDMTVLTEIMALREEIGELKGSLAAPDSEVAETVAQIREDVRAMKDEPDLSALNEVLALRDEFQAMKDEIASRKTDEATKSDEEILAEVQSLRDQLFAISMANVNDGSTDKVTYESYNNIILDELTALREEVNAYKTSDTAREVMEEIAEIKSSIAAQTADESELMTQLSKLKNDLEALKNNDAKDATNNAVLQELANLKTELTNQREADLTTLNFMSEMAHLIERQNQYINQNANSKITDEIESLKAEIASSLSAPSVETSVIMSEIAELKEELSRDSGRNVDNQTILDELAKLKDEISAEKPSQQNTIVLEEIARLKDEIGLLSEKNASEGKDVSVEEISQSINDLKNELTQIADIVAEEDKPKRTQTARKSTSKSGAKKPAAKKSSTAKSTSARSGAKKSSTAKKSTTKKKPIETKSSLSSDELLSKIESVSIDIPQTPDNADMGFNANLDINYVPDKSQEELDIASKLAKQVANKLIMEQLVEQLGNGGVPENEVEEIVKDILPQEFSTVMIEEQSDQVRRLANSLVLDKLRARLTGRKDGK